MYPTHSTVYSQREAAYNKLGFPAHAFHNKRMAEVVETFRNIKKENELATLEVSMKELLQRRPGAPPPPAGREDWSAADFSLWTSIEAKSNHGYHLALYLLADGADVRRVDLKTGNNLLHVCVENDANALVIRLLLRNGADPTVKNLNGHTPADLLRQRLLARLPMLDSPEGRKNLKATADQLNDRTFRATVEATFDVKIQRDLAEAAAQWPKILEDEEAARKFRARLREQDALLIATMAGIRKPLDGVDPKEIGRFARQLAEGVPEFQSPLVETMITHLDLAIWNAKTVYGPDDPRFLAVVAVVREILSNPAKR